MAMPAPPTPASDLPIEDVIEPIRAELRTGVRLVISAPPGAGKTTRVPLALLDEAWAAGRKLILVEPRRIAARAAAERMATSLGERVGQTIGLGLTHDQQQGHGQQSFEFHCKD